VPTRVAKLEGVPDVVWQQIKELSEPVGVAVPARRPLVEHRAEVPPEPARPFEERVQRPGIGPKLARSIEMLAITGRLPLLDRLLGENQPEALLATVPGVGPELVRRIYEKLGVRSLEDLERAAHDGRLAEVPGMGAKRRAGIRDTLAGRLGRRPSQHTRPAT